MVGAPIAGVKAFFGAASTGLSALNKKLEKNVNKHATIPSLAFSESDTINGLVSRAIDDNIVSNREFQQIPRA